MTTLLTAALAGLLAIAPPSGGDPTGQTTTAPVLDEGSATKPRPAPASAADTVVAAAFQTGIDTAPKDLKATPPAPPPGLDWTNLVAPALALAGLAALAFGLTRRRRALGGHISIVESAALGPKRSLVIADVLGDRLVLAVSEAGVTVLMTKPAPQPLAEPEPRVDPAILALPPELRQPVERAEPKMGFFARVFGRTPSPAPRFDELLGESIEDQELRAKLAAGMKGYVP